MEHQLVLKPVEHEATIGKPLTVNCGSRGADPHPKLSIKIGGRNISEIYGASLQPITQTVGFDYSVEGKLIEVSSDMFNGDKLEIECLAHFDDFLFARKETALPKAQYDYRHDHRPAPGSYNRRNEWENDSRYRQQNAERRSDEYDLKLH